MGKEDFLAASDDKKYEWWNRQRQLMAIYQLIIHDLTGGDFKRQKRIHERLQKEFDLHGDDYSDLHISF